MLSTELSPLLFSGCGVVFAPPPPTSGDRCDTTTGHERTKECSRRQAGEPVAMTIRDWKEVIDEDLPESKPVTAKTKEAMMKHQMRFRGGVRIATMRVWEDDAFEARRRRVLSTPLP